MVRRALFWSFVGVFSNLLINFSGSVVIARLLTPREVGVYAVSMATLGILQLFASFGISLYVVREEALSDRTVHAAFTLNALISLTLAAILFLSSFAGAQFLGEPAVASVLQMMALLPVISLFGFTPGVMLQRAMLNRGSSIIGTISSLITTGVTIWAALAGKSYMSYAYGSLASTIFSTIALILIGRKHFTIRVSTAGWRRMLVFGFRVMSIGGISSAAARLSDIVVGRMLGLSALGLYSRASTLNNMLFSSVYGTMTSVVFARLSKAQRDGDDVSEVYLTGLRLVTGIMGPILIGLAVLAGPILHTLYGERWLAAAPVLSLLLVGQFVSLSFAMNWELFVVRDRLQTQTWLELARSALAVGTQVIGGFFSLVAVAATSIVDSVVSMVIYGRYMPKLANTTRERLTNIYSEASLLTAVAIAPALLLMVVTAWNTRPSVLAVVSVVALGVLAWLVTVWKIGHPIAYELRLLIRQIRTYFGGPARTSRKA